MKLKCSLLKLTMAIGLIGVNYTCVAQSSVDGDYYVSPYGSDANPGTFDQPFATAQKAQSVANAGDVIYFRGGDYSFIGNDDADGIGVLFDKSGSQEAPISYFAYPGEVPVFDFSYFQPQARIRGFSVRANWLHFKGLEIKGVQQVLTNVNESWGIRVENNASHNIFENLNLHHNEGPGLFIADGRDNLVLNVDSHHNYDPDRGGENADGFGCHSNDGGNVFRGCRAWSNSDDGFDFINAPGTCTVEYSMAFNNGFIPGTNTRAGNGTGIKAGGFGLDSSRFPSKIPRHLVRFNIAFGNRINGFYSNHHPGGLDFINNTAFNNPYNYNMLADVGAANHYLRNNVSFGSGTDLAKATIKEIDSSHNSWDLDVTVDKNDFMSVDEALATADREADGSLPVNNFLRLLENSDLVDAGENVGYSYNGKAPDLGAFEAGGGDEQQPEPATSVTLNSQIRNGSVELGWSVTNADFSSQEIYRDSDPNPSGRVRIASLGADVRSFVDNSPNVGSTYYYWVKGIKRDGSTINSNVSSATLPNPSDPSPTIEESVTLDNQIRNGSVELSWRVTNADFSALDIYRDNDSNPNGRVRIARLGASASSYVDNSPEAGSTYYYWVKGIKRDGSVINSNVSSATLPNPSDPSPTIEESVTLDNQIRNGSVELSWRVTNADFSALDIYRDNDSNPSGRVRIARLSANASSYIDNSPRAGSTYYYWVKGIKRDGSVINSNVSSATLPNSNSPDTSPTIEESVTLDNQIRNGSVELSWRVTNADFSALDIYRDNDSNPSGRVRIARLRANMSSYVDNRAKAGSTYYYWVKGIKRDGNVVNSNVSSATLPNSPDTRPAVKESVTLDNQIRNGSVELSWSATNAGFSALDIYRDSDPNPNGRVRIARLGANVSSYVDNSPKAGSTNYYWVKGIKRGGSVINSNVTSATLPNPSVTLDTQVRNGSVELIWSATNADFSALDIYRDSDPNPKGRVRIGRLRANVSSYVDNRPKAGRTSYYWVKGITRDGRVVNSNVASATLSN